MNAVFDIYTIIFLALAVFIFARLRSVLGTRTGRERPPFDPYNREAPKPVPASDKPAPIARNDEAQAQGPRDAAGGDVPAAADRWAGIAAPGSALANGLDAIARADRDFDAQEFLGGAKAAYEMIVTAFAEGDRKTLRSLLGKEMFEEFASAINDREAKGHKMESRFVSIDKADFVAAALEGREARVTIRFISQLVSATRDKNGQVVEGSDEQLTEASDNWIFARDVTASDPNWKLVENEAP